MEKTFIYTLSDPLTLNIRYVGKSDNPEKRLKCHLSDNLNRTHKERWLSSLKKLNLNPIMEILDIVDKKNWVFWEQYWIAQLKQWGFNLTNIGIGGEGGNCTPETRKKISDSKKGKKPRLGAKCTDEQKAKMSQSQKGKKQKIEHINKRVEKNKKYINIEKLKFYYYDKGFNYKKIGEIFNLSESKIYSTLKENNLIKKKK